MADNEDSTAPLGDSENSVNRARATRAVPDFGQLANDDPEVPTAVRGEQSGYVLNEQPGGSNSCSDSGEFVEEPRALAGETGSLPGDGNVLAGEPSTEHVDPTSTSAGRPRP